MFLTRQITLFGHAVQQKMRRDFIWPNNVIFTERRITFRTMKNSEKIAACSFTLLFGLAAFLFFAFQYPYHIHWQEQYQLFEYTSDYLLDVVSVPGGVADYVGRFLTQFFYYARAGAAINALLLCAIALSVWSLTGRKRLGWFVACHIPAVLMWVFMCDENALTGAPVALLTALLFASCFSGTESSIHGKILLPVVSVLLYFICGPVAVVFPLLALCREDTRIAVGAVILFTLTPWVCGYLFGYPPGRFYTGIHYHRFHNVVHLMLWLSVLSATLIPLLTRLLTSFRTRNRSGAWSGYLLAAVFAAVIPFAVKNASDFVKEEQMKYDFMVQHRMWNRLMMTADAKPPRTPLTVTCLNLALAMSGRMADHQFEYFQNGPDGLLPEFVRDFTSPLPTSEVYYHLGMVNTAQRFTFEAQESIPDFQKSARCYKRLAETNYINGDTQVCEKYLRALRHTLFYRRWAERFPQGVEYGSMAERRLKEHDFLFSQGEMDSMLGLLYVENRENAPAFDYLLSWCLLSKRLDRFWECLRLRNYEVLPKSYQEALILSLALREGLPDTSPAYISSSVYVRLKNFLQAYDSGRDMAWMQKNFGDTYWFYYYFRYNGGK